MTNDEKSKDYNKIDLLLLVFFISFFCLFMIQTKYSGVENGLLALMFLNAFVVTKVLK